MACNYLYHYYHQRIRLELLLQILNHPEIPSFQEITKIGTLRVCEVPQIIWTFIHFLREKKSFNLFIDKGLEPIMIFTLLIHVSNDLDDYDIWLANFWPIFVKKSLKALSILGLLQTSTLLIESFHGRFVDFIFDFPIICFITFYVF